MAEQYAPVPQAAAMKAKYALLVDVLARLTLSAGNTLPYVIAAGDLDVLGLLHLSRSRPCTGVHPPGALHDVVSTLIGMMLYFNSA